MRSMTGFGAGEATLPATTPGGATGKVSVEIRAVNHRFLDLRVHLPPQLPDLASWLEGVARERLTRGRFDISVRVDGPLLRAMTLDRDRARTVLAALKELRDEVAPGADVPLALLASVPDLFVPGLQQDGAALRDATFAAFEAAVHAIDAMRRREGEAVRDDLRRRLAASRLLFAKIGERGPLVVDGYRKRLRDRADRLRTAIDVDVDPGRLEHELALFADRIDIAEEGARLACHAEHFEALLAASEAVGRRLDFLLQEMAREANTIGAKSQDAGISHCVVELKAEIERMREQVQNVE